MDEFSDGFYHGFTEWHGFRPNGEHETEDHHEDYDTVAAYTLGYVTGWLIRWATLAVIIILSADAATNAVTVNV